MCLARRLKAKHSLFPSTFVLEWSYFQNNMPVFKINTTVCTYFMYSTYQKRLSEKTVFSYTSLSILLILFLRPSSRRQLGPPRSALSDARALPPPAGRAAGCNNRRRSHLLPLPLPSPPRGRSDRLRAPPPPPPPPPTATPSCHCFICAIVAVVPSPSNRVRLRGCRSRRRRPPSPGTCSTPTDPALGDRRHSGGGGARASPLRIATFAVDVVVPPQRRWIH
jgi:hypothetical protein